jgi:hypothetical protein
LGRYINKACRAKVIGTGCIPPLKWRGLALLSS